MKRKWIRGLALAVTLATTLGAALVWPLAGSAAEKVDLERGSSLKVAYPTGIIGNEDAWLADMKTADVVVDVYRVAAAKENSGYDGYYYDELDAAYAGLLEDALEEDNAKPEEERIKFSDYLTEGKINMDAADSVFWEALAQAAAKRTIEALKGSADSSQDAVKAAYVDTITVTESAEAGLEELESGLYLLIPHDAHLQDAEQYSILEDGRIVTLAYSKVHGYAFDPILISLPAKEAYDYEEGGVPGSPVINTGNPGEWLYDMTVALKAWRLNGSLEIVKRVPNYENSEPATFVFRVSAVSPLGEQVFDRVLSLTFTEAGEKKLLIENIPAGSAVTVTEEYSGGYRKEPGALIRFERVDGRTAEEADGNPVPDVIEPDRVIPDDAALAATTVEIGAARMVVVEFENNYDYDRRGGHGITNHFSYDSENGWSLTQFSDNAADAAGTTVPGNPEPAAPAGNE